MLPKAFNVGNPILKVDDDPMRDNNDAGTTDSSRTPDKIRSLEENYNLVFTLAAEWLVDQKTSNEEAALSLDAFIKHFTADNPDAPAPKSVQEFYDLKEGKNSIRNVPIEILPPSLLNNVLAVVFGVIAILPPLIVGLNMDCDVDQSEFTFESTTTVWGVLIPGFIWIYVSAMAHGSLLREMAGQDTLEEKSKETTIDETCKNNLTNTGIIGALLFTVVTAMLQADAPQDNAERFLSRWYQIFLLAGLVASFVSICQASVLLIYIEPLDNHAAALFSRHMIDYFGEPVPCILMTVLNSIYALVLWVFGVYGKPSGTIALFALFFCIQRLMLTVLYCSSWRNPFITDEERHVNKYGKEPNEGGPNSYAGCFWFWKKDDKGA